MPRRLLTRWRRTCNRSPLTGSSREYPNTIPTPPTILSRPSAPASGASALIRESERMHTPGQFGPPASADRFSRVLRARETLENRFLALQESVGGTEDTGCGEGQDERSAAIFQRVADQHRGNRRQAEKSECIHWGS